MSALSAALGAHLLRGDTPALASALTRVAREEPRALLSPMAVERVLDAVAHLHGRAHGRDALDALGAAFPETGLVLSGGGAIAFFHLGVAKALLGAGVLPRLISGSSMGAMIGAGIAARSDEELMRGFSEPSRIARGGLELLRPFQMLKQRALCSSEELLRIVEHNVGPLTFAQAHARTGRTLVISVAAARPGHPIRLLCRKTAPGFSIPRAAVASSALPILFPPFALEPGGERYMDGSFGGDVPIERLRQDHGVGHFIVSQANPYVLPFLKLRAQRPAHRAFLGAMRAAARATRPAPVLGSALSLARGFVDQRFAGDITVAPEFEPQVLLRAIRIPSVEELSEIILAGEASITPLLPLLKARQRLVSALTRRNVAG